MFDNIPGLYPVEATQSAIDISKNSLGDKNPPQFKATALEEKTGPGRFS
jgi:hypothetical protein